MQFQITAKNVEVTDALRELVNEKIGKLARYLPSIMDAKIELSQEATRSPAKRFTVQATVNTKGVLLRGEEKAENIQAAVDAVAEVLARQIKRYKEKRYDKGRGVSGIRQTAEAPAETPEPDGSALPEDVVKVKRFPVKPMAISEAVDQMELLGHDFFLFINSEGGKFSCLYRRQDGKYGLIEAELA